MRTSGIASGARSSRAAPEWRPVVVLSTCCLLLHPAVVLTQATPATARGPDELTLGEVLHRALIQHPRIEAARFRVHGAEGARITAGAFPNPVATYQVENGRYPGDRAATGIDREISSFVTLPLEPLFQRWPRVRRADEDVRAAEASLTTARREVALDAARAFYRVALAQASVEAALETHAALEQLVGYNRTRVAEGATAEGDLIRVEVELARAATSVTTERVELARARAELLPFLGSSDSVGSADSVRVTVPAAFTRSAILPDLASLLGRAREARSELVAARARVASARAESRYQRTLTVRQVGATFGNKRVEGTNTMLLGVSAPVPLFDRNRGDVQQATSERRALEQELAWTERMIAAEVEAAYTAARLLGDQVASLQGTFLSRAEESRRIALAAYEEGAGSLLQVLDASRALGDARLTYYRTLFAQRASLVELDAAVGIDPAGDGSGTNSSSASTLGDATRRGRR